MEEQGNTPGLPRDESIEGNQDVGGPGQDGDQERSDVAQGEVGTVERGVASQPDGNGVGGNREVQEKATTERALGAWEEIGFHRPLAAWMWDFVIDIFGLIVGLFTSAWIIGLLYPYPEQRGYSDIAGIPFAIFYQLFDVGTAFGIKRFIAEYRIKNPKKMLEYIRFFVWYQMHTGIIQVLVISIIAIQVIRFNELAYLTWLFLINCQKQWPGMLGTFKACIDGLQHYSKSKVLGFINGQIFQMFSNIGFILLGRYLGNQDPAIGELMGATIGMVIGGYVDDFFAMWLSAYFFNKVMKPYGIKFREAWRFDFGKDVAKNCLNFGLQVSVVPLINTATGTLMSLMLIDAVTSYATWKTIIGYAGGLVGIVAGTTLALTESIAESYCNGKRELARFYIANSFKWDGFLKMIFFCVFLTAYPSLLIYINEVSSMENYLPALAFILPALVPKFLNVFIDMPNGILVGTNHIGFYTIIRLVEEGLQVFFMWFWLYFLQVQVHWGTFGLVVVLSWEHLIPKLIKMTCCWLFIQVRVLGVRVYWMQSYVIPLLSALPMISLSPVISNYMFLPLIGAFEPLVGNHDLAVQIGAAISATVAIFAAPLVFFPLTGMLGGWDDFQLSTFKKAVNLAGPSKFIFAWFYKLVLLGKNTTLGRRLHGRYAIPYDDAKREIAELMEIKRRRLAKTVQKPLVKSAPWLKKVDMSG